MGCRSALPRHPSRGGSAVVGDSSMSREYPTVEQWLRDRTARVTAEPARAVRSTPAMYRTRRLALPWSLRGFPDGFGPVDGLHWKWSPGSSHARAARTNLEAIETIGHEQQGAGATALPGFAVARVEKRGPGSPGTEPEDLRGGCGEPDASAAGGGSRSRRSW